MQANSTTALAAVNSELHAKAPLIWSRNFKAEITALGKANNCYIDVYKELRIALGNAYEVAGAIIELARRFGNGFHFSNNEFLLHMGNTISDAKLYRDKQKLKKLGVLHLAATVKNRTMYFLQEGWFENLILGLFTKLGIQQRHNDGSHIISSDLKISKTLVNHDHMKNDFFKDSNTEQGYQEYAQQIQNEVPRPQPKTDEAKLVKTLRGWKVPFGSIRQWLKDHPAWYLFSAIEASMNKNNPGGYMRTIIEGLDERKAQQKQKTREAYSAPAVSKQYYETAEKLNTPLKKSDRKTARAFLAEIKTLTTGNKNGK